MVDLVPAAVDRTLAARLAPYRAVLGSRIRSQRSFRSNFLIDLVSSLLTGVVELVETTVLYLSVTRIGGLDLHAILLVYGLAALSFSLADLVVGHCDTLPRYIREGTIDVFYLRPQPLLLQLITSDISLRRLARAAVGLVTLGAGLVVNDIDLSVRTVALLVLAVVSGTATYAAMFVWAAGAQFFLLDGAEATNAFVYGGRYAATQPASVWDRPLKALFGFLFPMAFTAYLPAITLLHLAGPEWMPTWLGWFAPVAAVWMWVFALVFWRLGVRHYQGGGG